MIDPIIQWKTKVDSFRNEALQILSSIESSKARVLSLNDSWKKLTFLSLKQENLFRESLKCIEHNLHRAAIVMAWTAFMDYFWEKVSEVSTDEIFMAFPKWKEENKDFSDLKENIKDYQVISCAKKLNLISKNDMKALHGNLHKRNECAHPSGWAPGLNESLGYVSELFNRIELIESKRIK